jgi:hypothetical protein
MALTTSPFTAPVILEETLGVYAKTPISDATLVIRARSKGKVGQAGSKTAK